MKVGFSTVAGTGGSASSSTTPALTSTASCCWTAVASWGRSSSAGHVQDLGVVRAMTRRKTDVPRWRQMLHGERINYGMLAYESAGR